MDANVIDTLRFEISKNKSRIGYYNDLIADNEKHYPEEIVNINIWKGEIVLLQTQIDRWDKLISNPL